jgi:hypothetical protein
MVLQAGQFVMFEVGTILAVLLLARRIIGEVRLRCAMGVPHNLLLSSLHASR